jgi:hypothetical protein
MRGAIPPLHNTPSWCGAQLRHGDNFTFTQPPPTIFRNAVSIEKIKVLFVGIEFRISHVLVLELNILF